MRALAPVLVLAACASAQQPLYLTARPAEGWGGGGIRAQLSSGAADWSHTQWLCVRSGQSQENMDRPPAPDAAGAVTLPLPERGPAVVGLDLEPVIEEMDAEKLREFAAARCAEQLPPNITGKVKVRRVRSCKALLAGPGSGSVPMSKTGQWAEFKPLMDPTRAIVDSDIAFSISVGGLKLDRLRMLAGPVAGPIQDQLALDGHGRLRVTAAGPWRVELNVLRPAAPGSGADWELASATLTFDVPGANP